MQSYIQELNPNSNLRKDRFRSLLRCPICIFCSANESPAGWDRQHTDSQWIPCWALHHWRFGHSSFALVSKNDPKDGIEVIQSKLQLEMRQFKVYKLLGLVTMSGSPFLPAGFFAAKAQARDPGSRDRGHGRAVGPRRVEGETSKKDGPSKLWECCFLKPFEIVGQL